MTSAPLIQLLIAEDHAVVREGLVAIIKDEKDMAIVAQAENGQQAVDLYRQYQPDIVLMDLRMPILEGVAAITQIRAEFAHARIIVLTTYDGDEDIYRGLQAGARGYMLKDATSEEMLDAIRKVHQGGKYIPPQVALKLAERLNSTQLTNRELEVLQLLVIGKSNAEIGAVLSISEHTVKFHINNVFNKLGVGDRTQAAIQALKRGLARLAL
ncbi:response regulator transcription factor [Phormidium tenue FACHB-886]|nr:response regulator transcription factor [Phormidium tenue FACHB-886]